MRRNYNKQKGEVLITLVVAFLIVGLLASSALKYSYTGLNITKSFNKYSGKSYMAEKVLNIIKAGIEEDCSEILEREYDKMLDTYAYTPNSQRNLTFKEYYINSLKSHFIGTVTDEEENTVDIIALFKDYINRGEVDGEPILRDGIKLASSTSDTGIHLSVASNPVFSDDENYFIFKDVRVQYIDSDGFSSTVGADIRVEVPFIFEDTEEGFEYDSGYLDYTLIADKGISFDATNTDIVGGVYGGDSITIGEGTTNTNIDVKGKAFHTRGDIKMYSGCSLSVAPLDTTNESNIPNVFAKNISIEKRLGSTAPATLSLNANTYVEDDLEVNAENSVVTLKGNYLGYGKIDGFINQFKPTDDNPSIMNSSIILNTPNSILDVSGLSTLKILGNASIIAPANNNLEIITDESVTSKYMQIMYSIPSVCMPTITNPMPSSVAEEFNVANIEWEKSATTGGLDLMDAKYAIDRTNPIIVQTPGSGDRDGLVYYFLRFKTKAGQSAYIDDYSRLYNEYLTNKTRSLLGSGRIIVGKNMISWSDGNIMQFEDEETDSEDSGSEDSTTSWKLINGGGLTNTESLVEMTKNDARDINTTLMLNQSVSEDDYAKGVWESIIRTELIEENSGYDYGYYTLGDAEHIKSIDMDAGVKAEIIANKEALIRKDVDCIIYLNKSGAPEFTVPAMRGLVIANCDKVIVDSDFMGLIITPGKIIVSGASQIYNGDEEADSYPALYLLLQYAGQDTIRQYFRNFELGGGGTEQSASLKIKSLITFDNWVAY